MISIYDELAEMYAERAYMWKIGGEYRVPTSEDIQAAVDRAAAILESEPDGSMLEVGRLIIQKNLDVIDLYLHIGETR